MWVTTPTIFPIIKINTNPLSPTFSSTRNRHNLTTVTASSNEITGLGQALLKAQSKGGAEKKGKELNGSDILWALQKASAKKAQVKSNNKKVQMKNGSGANLKKEDPGRVVGYDEVRPVIVKSDWGSRLDDLEKRIQHFLSI